MFCVMMLKVYDLHKHAKNILSETFIGGISDAWQSHQKFFVLHRGKYEV